MWVNDVNCESIIESQVGNSLFCLAKYVFKHHGKKSILLIDEFDCICSKALFEVKREVLDHIIRFYSKIVSQVVKQDTRLVERAILTGVAHITCKGLSPINNVKPYKFLDNENFFVFYGILEASMQRIPELT